MADVHVLWLAQYDIGSDLAMALAFLQDRTETLVAQMD